MTLFYVAAHALVRRAGRYLVTRRSADNDYMPLKWDLPGGTVEPGETLEDALIREVFEETGLKVEVRGVLHVYSDRHTLPARQTVQCVYACDHVAGEVRLNPSEHTAFAWLDAGDLRSLDAIGFLADLVHSGQFTTGT